MTDSKQRKAMEDFRSGASKLLVATSVAEEGIDIPDCNLVILYNYGTDEKGRIQTAGNIVVLIQDCTRH